MQKIFDGMPLLKSIFQLFRASRGFCVCVPCVYVKGCCEDQYEQAMRWSGHVGEVIPGWRQRFTRFTAAPQIIKAPPIQVVAAGATCQAEPPVIDEVHERQIELLQSWRTKRAADRCLVG